MSDVIRIDCRSIGGGLRTDSKEDAILTDYRVAYSVAVAPMGGYQYPSLKTHVVKVPYTLLSDYGGTMSEAQIKSLIQKSLAAGEYVILDFTGTIPSIVSVEPV